jgi:hypothetical protein
MILSLIQTIPGDISTPGRTVENGWRVLNGNEWDCQLEALL